MTNEEVVSRITGLPVERVEILRSEHGMPVTESAFSAWAVDNFETPFAEQKKYFEELLFPRELRPELSETPA